MLGGLLTLVKRFLNGSCPTKKYTLETCRSKDKILETLKQLTTEANMDHSISSFFKFPDYQSIQIGESSFVIDNITNGGLGMRRIGKVTVNITDGLKGSFMVIELERDNQTPGVVLGPLAVFSGCLFFYWKFHFSILFVILACAFLILLMSALRFLSTISSASYLKRALEHVLGDLKVNEPPLPVS